MSSAAPLPRRRDAAGAGGDKNGGDKNGGGGGNGGDKEYGGAQGGSPNGLATGGAGPDLVDGVQPQRGEWEADPTGIRALLASLPDPGPMPPTLVRRITESLAAEQARTVGTATSSAIGGVAVSKTALDRTTSNHTTSDHTTSEHTPGHTPPAHLPPRTTSTSPAPSRPPQRDGHTGGLGRRAHGHRSRWQRPVLAIAGAAAAAAVVGTLGINLVQGSSPAGSAASSAANLNSADPSKAASADSRAAMGDARDRPAASGQALATIQLRASATHYTSTNLADRSRQLLTLRTSAGAPESSAGPLATTNGAWRCLQALGVPSSDRAAVDVATYEGQPAAVLVATGGGRSTAYVVRRDCRRGHPGTLRAPLALR